MPVVPVLSKVKISPSHLAALLGVLGSELQLERRRVFLRGELLSSAATSNSGNSGQVHLLFLLNCVYLGFKLPYYPDYKAHFFMFWLGGTWC